MFDNMKHCVAIGGADCCWGWGLLPMMAETLGGAGPGPIFNAEAAYSGIWKPVPKKKLYVYYCKTVLPRYKYRHYYTTLKFISTPSRADVYTNQTNYKCMHSSTKYGALYKYICIHENYFLHN